MEFVVRKFDELSARELFEIYRLRVSVFVVEQQCPYQEVDDYDPLALHVMLREGNRILAYLRVLPQNTAFEDAAIGRVIAAERRRGYGSAIVSKGLELAQQCFGADSVSLEAQTYARSLYEKLGFVQASEEFLEDGIPHIKMNWRSAQ